MSRSFGPPSSTLRSPNYEGRFRGKRLTDKMIEKYILAGRYGEARRKALADRLAVEAAPKKIRKSAWKETMKLLK